jgi:hypothetical protein
MSISPMLMTIIDYTVFFYTTLAALSVPAVVAGKFVQIRNGNTLYLVFSPKEFTKYHANIVERFCMDKGIEGSYDSKREIFAITDQSWQITGGGKFERDANKKTIKLYDNSMAYGKFDVTGLKEIFGALPEFSGYAVSIE